VDRDLIDLLKFCHKLFLTYKEGNDDYATDLYMKSFELGKKVKNKVLIFDMDETLVSARFESRLIEGFKTTFTFDFHGQTMHVRTRPYLYYILLLTIHSEECLSRLASMYEIVVFTAG